MSFYYIKHFVMILTTALPVAVGIYRYRAFDMGSKIFYYSSILCMIAESLAFYAAVYFHNNLVVYNIANIIELFTISVYFNYTIRYFRRKNIGLIIGVSGLIIGVVNNFFIQSIYGITDYFLSYQALVTIAMSIVSLSTFLKPNDKREAKKEVHFWLPVILIFSWIFSYLLFTLIAFFSERLKQAASGVLPSLFLICVVTNLSTAAVFFLYPKMHAHVR